MSDDTSISDDFLKGMSCLKAGHPSEGATLLRKAAFSGHAEAQNQLASLYFAGLKSRTDLADLEVSAQSNDHVALFVLAMSLIEGRLLEQDTDRALLALKRAAEAGNIMAAQMLRQSTSSLG